MIDVRTSYYQWICNRIQAPEQYSKLLWQMFHTEFHPIMMMDANRYQDAIDMRYDYGYYNNVPDDIIAACVDVYDPSVLEVMAALAYRMENETLHDHTLGDRTSRWFWDMMHSLGVDIYTDASYDAGKVHMIIHNFIYRYYKPNGEGGLFTINGVPRDLRTVDIWTQSTWKMNDYIK